MAYVTQQDLIDRYGEDELIQLTDRTNLPASTIDAAVVSAAIGDAENLADSYIAKKYQVPLVPVPDVLIPIICQISRYYLHGRRLDKDDPITRDFERAIAWLKDVANGTVQLEAEGKASGQSGSGAVQVTAPSRVFSRDTLGGY